MSGAMGAAQEGRIKGRCEGIAPEGVACLSFVEFYFYSKIYTKGVAFGAFAFA